MLKGENVLYTGFLFSPGGAISSQCTKQGLQKKRMWCLVCKKNTFETNWKQLRSKIIGLWLECSSGWMDKRNSLMHLTARSCTKSSQKSEAMQRRNNVVIRSLPEVRWASRVFSFYLMYDMHYSSHLFEPEFSGLAVTSTLTQSPHRALIPVCSERLCMTSNGSLVPPSICSSRWAKRFSLPRRRLTRVRRPRLRIPGERGRCFICIHRRSWGASLSRQQLYCTAFHRVEKKDHREYSVTSTFEIT